MRLNLFCPYGNLCAYVPYVVQKSTTWNNRNIGIT
jgi:hypothetical protein